MQAETERFALPLKEKAKRVLLSTTMAASLSVPPVALHPSCEDNLATSHIHEEAAPEALGFTFGKIAAEFNGLNPNQTLEVLLRTELPHTSLVRLAAYMNEPTDRILSDLRSQIEIAQENNASVILTVGGKAPHYPEWYINPADQETELAKAKAVLEAFGDNPTVTYFQLSNEPFHRDWHTPPENDAVLQTIYNEMKSYGKDILITHLVEPNHFDEAGFRQAAQYGDIIGLDIYTQVGLTRATCDELVHTLQQYKALADSLHKPLWITESQTRPWEAGPLFFFLQHILYKPFQPEEIAGLYKAELMTVQPAVILEWDAVTDYKDALTGQPKTLTILKHLGEVQHTVVQKLHEANAPDQGMIISFPLGRPSRPGTQTSR